MKRFWAGFWFLTAIIRFPTAMFAAPTVMFSEEPTPPSQTPNDNPPNDNADEPKIEFYTQDDPEAEEIKFDKPKLHDFWPKNTAYLFVRNKPIADSVADFCKMQGIDAVLSERLKDNKQRVNRSFEKMYPTHIWDKSLKFTRCKSIRCSTSSTPWDFTVPTCAFVRCAKAAFSSSAAHRR